MEVNFVNDKLLSEYLEKSDLDLAKLARESQINRGTIYNILLGKNLPSYLVLHQLVECLKLTEEDFIKFFFFKNTI